MNTTYIIYDRAGNWFYTDPLSQDAQLELESAFRNQKESTLLIPVDRTILHIHGADIISLRRGI